VVVANGGLYELKDGISKQVGAEPSFGEISTIAEDQAGTLWLGNQEGAIYSRRSDELEFGPHPAAVKTSGFPIQVMVADAPESLWIGTRGGGLLRLQGRQSHAITSAQGIPDDDIRQIIPDNSGNLWIGAANGLFRVSKVELEAVAAGRRMASEGLRFGASYGLGNIEFQEGFRNTACGTRDGRLWFATTLGAVEVDPKRAVPKLNPPSVLIEQVTVDGQILNLRGSRRVVIPPASRRLEIKFTATSFRAIENVRFRHRLESMDADWVDAGAERSVSYYRVPPGEYRFRVIARGSNGRWNEEGAFVNILVQPTLWQMGWVRATALAVVLVLVGLVVRVTANRRWQRKMKELEQRQAVELERRRIARDMHDELGAGLTQLAFMGEQSRRKFSEDANVSARMEQISKTAKDIASKLDQIVWIVNPRNDTLEQLIGYLSQYTMDYLAATDIKFRQELPLKTPKHKIDSHVRHELLMAFKEVLANAVKHSGAQNIALSIQLKELQLRVTLSDDGRGFRPQEMSGLGDGLGNLRQRLEALGGSCHLESRPEAGTAVTLTLQVKPES
jgi:signal transduction histidine kinase